MTNRFTILAICLAVGLGTVADQAMAKKKKNKKSASIAEIYGYDHPSGKGYPNGRPWQALDYDFEIVNHKLDVLDHKVDGVKGDTETVIERTASLPAVVRRVFATHRNNQTKLTLRVVEGESRATADNRYVGQFKIQDLPPRPAGSVEVEVVFAMDESGGLSITARDLSTGKRTTGLFEID